MFFLFLLNSALQDRR